MLSKKRTNSALKSVFLMFIAVSLLCVGGCTRAIQKTETGKTDVAAVQDAPVLEGRKAKLSYAMGMVLGNQFRKQSIEVDPDLYVLGLKDALAGEKTLLTDTEAQAEVNMLKSELTRKRSIPPTADKITDIKVSFKLDPRLTRGQYMGNRWISSSTFASTFKEGTDLIVEAKVRGLDAHGRSVLINPEWIPSDPDMITIKPSRGDAVKIVVKRTGQSGLKVVSQNVTKELLIKATGKGETMKVEILQ